MNERDSRNQKEIEEFILVKNDKTPIFRETDVVVRPIAIGKNGPVFEVIDKDNNRIGIVNDNKIFQFDPQYKAQLKEKMGSYYDLLKFEEEILKYDVIKELQKQDEKENENEEEKRRNNNNDNKKESVELDNKKNQESNEKDRLKEEKSIPINKEELEEKTEGTITAFTIIKDDSVLEDMELSNDVDRNCVLIAEVDGEYQLLYREVGTNEIKQIKTKGDEDYSTQQVTRFKDNKEYKENMATRINVNPATKLELSVRKEYGQIKIDRVMRQENGEVILSEVETDIGYPTEEEKNRQNDERYNEGKKSEKSLLTEQEKNEEIINAMINEKVRNSNVKEMVIERVEGKEHNLTIEELEEIIRECDEEYSELNHEPKRDKSRIGKLKLN